MADLNLSEYSRLVDAEFAALQEAKDVKRVGYICNYVPLELLSAAGVRHARLLRAGKAHTVSAGELYTQSVFCDFTKSCIGFFAENDRFYKSFDKVYNFHSCSTMKRASEVIEQFVPVKLLNLPKLRPSPEARAFFREEILAFKEDLAALVGHPVEDAEVQRQITLYNQARGLLKKISDLRKRSAPPLTGAQFLDVARGYYYLPAEKLVDSLQRLYAHLELTAKGNRRPLRLMVSGSIVADGDRRLLQILEDGLGARVVVEDHCAGVRPFYHAISETDEPYQALASGYLDQAPCARMKPLTDGVAFSGRLAREYEVDAVVYVFLKFCACYGVTKKEFVTEFRGQGLPVLELSGDYSESDYGQLKTRVEAFIEVLNEKQHRQGSEESAHV